MKVKEMREVVSNLQKEGKSLKEVEFITDTKKYSADDIKAGIDTMIFNLSRNNFHKMTIDDLGQALDMAGGDLEVEIQMGTNKKVVTSAFNGVSSLELVAE